MSLVAKRHATYADIEALPDNVIGEIVDGDLHVSPRPSGPHSKVSSVLGMDIGSAFHRGRGGPGGWLIIDEPELHLGHDVMVPDLAGWRRERLAEVPTDHRFTVAPDWLCEVLSPSDKGYRRIKKLRSYKLHGVAYVWLVDPLQRTLEVLRLEHERWIVAQLFGADEGDDRVRAEPFEAIELELSALWWSPETFGHGQPIVHHEPADFARALEDDDEG